MIRSSLCLDARGDDTAPLLGFLAAVRLRRLLRFAPYPQEVAAPQFGYIAFRVASAKKFGGHVLALAFAVPALDAAAVIEVRCDAHVVDADFLDGVGDRLYELGYRAARGRRQDLLIA